MGGRAVLATVAVAVGGLSFLVDVGPSASSATGVLTYRATLATDSRAGVCPPQAPSSADCRARTGTGSVSGLGHVVATYNWFFDTGSDCPSTLVKPLATTARFAVAGKGTIEFAVAEGRCVDVEPVRNEPQEFTITGGTGAYQGASGHGRIERSLSGGRGVEWWDGTLTVAGLDFDTTPPTISGAVSRTVSAPAGAKRLRVTYKVTARDAVDGAVSVVCEPRSGAFFKFGRTAIGCTANDLSGNARIARFVITVRR